MKNCYQSRAISAFVLGFLLTSQLSHAEQTVVTAPAPAAAESRIIGSVDLRPSMDLTGNVFRTEDSVELGYQFSPGRTMSYVQSIGTNLQNPDPTVSGVNLSVDDGFLRTRLGKLWESKELGLNFSYQSRVYLPVSSTSRDKSMIATFRNYLTLSKTISDAVTVTFSELPIFGVYSRPGSVNAAGVATANMAFENRFYLITDITLSDKLSLSLPLFFHQTKARNFAGATNDGAWTFTVWTYPELTYAVTENTSLGLAYYSGNMVAKDLSRVDVGEGLRNGTLQVVLGASL